MAHIEQDPLDGMHHSTAGCTRILSQYKIPVDLLDPTVICYELSRMQLRSQQ